MKLRLLLNTLKNGLFILALLFAGYSLLNTETGLRLTFSLARKFIPGKLQADKINGYLVGPIYFSNLSYENDSINFKVNQLQIDWKLKHLIQRQLTVKDLKIDQASLIIKPSRTSTSSFAWQTLLTQIKLKQANINQFSIQYNNVKIKIFGQIDKQWRLNWLLDIPNLKELDKNLQGHLVLDGRIDGAYRSPQILISLNHKNLKFNDLNINYLQGFLRLSLNPTNLKMQLTRFNIDLPNIKNLQGQLIGDININDEFSKQGLNGQILVNNTSAQIPELNLVLTNIHIKSLIKPNAIQWTGNLKSGPGYLSLAGNTSLQQKTYSTVLIAQGQNLVVSNTQNYKVIANPRLQIHADTKRIEITGDIFLPRANIKLGADEESNILELSSDVVFADQKKSASVPNIAIYSKINLTLGDDINLLLQGLHAKLNGELTLTDEPNRPTHASGMFTFSKGSYKFYGEKFTIQDNSKVLFTGGPIDNPLLDVTAIKKIKTVPPANSGTNTISSEGFFSGLTQPLQEITLTVGVHVQGTAQNPQYKLFSQPIALSQTDILSYLITGQPASQLSTANSQLIFNAATNLGGKDNDLRNLMKSLRQSMDLDELSIQSKSFIDPATNALAQTPSLVLGKALSPRLYVNYSIGLLQPANILQISYLINKYLSVQSANSTLANSIDLMLKVEK